MTDSDFSIDEQVEAHLRRTLSEVALTTPFAITQARSELHRTNHRVLTMAAGVLLVAGAVGLVVIAEQVDEPSQVLDVTDSDPVPTPAEASNQAGGRLLSTPVRSDVQPIITIERTDWRVASSESGAAAESTPSTGCPGCGARRLVLNGGGSNFGGPLFTAWTLDAVYDLARLDQLVMVGAVEGRANVSPPSTPVVQMRVTIGWSIDANRTAFVDASRMTPEQALELAAQLTFEGDIPALATPPVGFEKIGQSDASFGEQRVVRLTDGKRSLDVFATNEGVHGLLNWRNPFAHLFLNVTRSRIVDGAVVLVDVDDAPDRIGGYWVAGGWGYRADGAGFGSESEFLDVLGDLRLTDVPNTNQEEAMPLTYEQFDSVTGWKTQDDT